MLATLILAQCAHRLQVSKSTREGTNQCASSACAPDAEQAVCTTGNENHLLLMQAEGSVIKWDPSHRFNSMLLPAQISSSILFNMRASC